MDLLVPPDFQTEVKMRLDDMKIPFNVSIDDLQKAINEENPPISTIDEELDNRFSNSLDSINCDEICNISSSTNTLT